MKVQRSLDVRAPAQAIWPYFVVPEKILQWCITFKKFEYTNGQRAEVGTPVYIEEQAGGPLMKMNFEITECVENQMLTLTMRSGPMMKSYRQWWSLETIPTGTRINFAEEIEFGMGVLGKLLGSIQEKASLATIDKMLARLKEMVET